MAALLLHAFLVMAQGISANPSGVVTGVLRTQEGAPAAGIRVAAIPAVAQEATPAPLVAQTQTDASGRYRLEQIPAGRYYLIAGLIEYPTYYPGVTSSMDAKVVDLAQNGVANGLDFSLRRSADIKVSGRVIGRLDLAANREVTLQGLGAPTLSTTFNDDGSFEFSKVLPGRYIIRTAGPIRFPVTQIEVFNRDVTGIEVALPAEVSGRVVIEDGSSPASFMIQANDVRSSNVLASGVRADGNFTLTMPDGEYRFSLGGPTTAYALKSVTFGSADVTTAPLKIDRTVAPQDLLITIIRTTPPPTVPGVKVGGHIRGGGTEGMHIALVAKSAVGRTYSEIEVTADGSFVFTNVEPGTYTIVAYGAKQVYTEIRVADKDVEVELTR